MGNKTLGCNWRITNLTGMRFNLISEETSFIYEAFEFPQAIGVNKSVGFHSELINYNKNLVSSPADRQKATCRWVYQSEDGCIMQFISKMPPCEAEDSFYPRIFALSQDVIVSPDSHDYGHDKTRTFEILSFCEEVQLNDDEVTYQTQLLSKVLKLYQQLGELIPLEKGNNRYKLATILIRFIDLNLFEWNSNVKPGTMIGYNINRHFHGDLVGFQSLINSLGLQNTVGYNDSSVRIDLQGTFVQGNIRYANIQLQIADYKVAQIELPVNMQFGRASIRNALMESLDRGVIVRITPFGQMLPGKSYRDIIMWMLAIMGAQPIMLRKYKMRKSGNDTWWDRQNKK